MTLGPALTGPLMNQLVCVFGWIEGTLFQVFKFPVGTDVVSPFLGTLGRMIRCDKKTAWHFPLYKSWTWNQFFVFFWAEGDKEVIIKWQGHRNQNNSLQRVWWNFSSLVLHTEVSVWWIPQKRPWFRENELKGYTEQRRFWQRVNSYSAITVHYMIAFFFVSGSSWPTHAHHCRFCCCTF